MSTENQDLSKEAFCSCFIALQSWSITRNKQNNHQYCPSQPRYVLAFPILLLRHHTDRHQQVGLHLNKSGVWQTRLDRKQRAAESGMRRCFLCHMASAGSSTQYTSSHYEQIWKKAAVSQRLFVGFIFSSLKLRVVERHVAWIVPCGKFLTLHQPHPSPTNLEIWSK